MMLTEELFSRLPARPPRPFDLLPGLRLSRGAALRNMGLPLALVALFALMPVMIVFTDPSAMFAIRDKATTTGRVEQVKSSRGCDGGSTEIFYSFSTREGVPFRGQETVCAGSPYAGVREGDAVPIVYVKDDPELHGIAGGRRTSAGFPFPVLLFPLFALLIFVPLFWPRCAQLLRDRKLYRSGPTLARGRVVFVTREQGMSWPGWPTSSRSTVYVQVQSPALGAREVQAVCTNEWLIGHLPPGAEVTVVCHANKPRAVLLENYLR
jgi:hypothetical protein